MPRTFWNKVELNRQTEQNKKTKQKFYKKRKIIFPAKYSPKKSGSFELSILLTSKSVRWSTWSDFDRFKKGSSKEQKNNSLETMLQDKRRDKIKIKFEKFLLDKLL